MSPHFLHGKSVSHRSRLDWGASVLALGAACLLLLSSGAYAQTVILDGNNVIRIENLEVFDDQGGPETYDVEFIYDTGDDVYRPDFDFDFNNEEDAISALESVLVALNTNNPTPMGAGSAGTDQFFIGAEVEDGFIAAVGGENFAGAWDQCDRDCVVGTAVLPPNQNYTWAKFSRSDGPEPPPSGSKVNLSGEVETPAGDGVCAMVLASGKFQFSCNPNGPFSLTNLDREGDGTVKRQVYADGFFPNVESLPDSVDETVVMQRAGNCPDYNVPSNPGTDPESAGMRVDISGTVLLGDTGTPICAMVLANGEYEFTCSGNGTYSLNIPLDGNGQFKLQVYADGFAPEIETFDESSLVNDVRMARASECN